MSRLAMGLILALCLLTPAGAVDLTRESLAGIHIGDSATTVTKRLGRPLKATPPRLGQATGQMESDLTYPSLDITLGDGRVTSIRAVAPSRFATSRDVHVGDAASHALSVYGALHQEDAPHYIFLTFVPGKGRIVQIFLGYGPE